MNKQDFKTKYIANLRGYLSHEHKDVKIMMRIAKKGEKCYDDTAIKSVRSVTHDGNRWRVEVRTEMYGLSELMLLAHYKTANVSWDYKGKEI